MPDTYKGFVMKKILCLSFILTIISLDVFAQKDIITIDNVKYKLNQTTQTAKVIYAKNQKVITIPNSISNKKVTYTVNSIAESAFEDNDKLNKLSLPSTISSIANYAFFNCTNLDSVFIQDISFWFDVNFGNHFSNPLYYGGSLYIANQKVTEITFPDTITYINNYIFCGYNGLKSVTLSKVTQKIGFAAFYKCESLDSVYIPNSVTHIGHAAFYKCSNLNFNHIDNNVIYVGPNAFTNTKWDKNLSENETIYIGKSLYMYAKDACGSISIEEGITQIHNNAFENCKNITYIILPSTIKYIESSALKNCTSLERIAFKSFEPQIMRSNVLYNVSIITPRNATEVYRQAINVDNDTIFSIKCSEKVLIDNDDITSEGNAEPVFPGGLTALMNYFAKNIKYPKDAYQKGIQGRVICRFTINKDGSVSDVEIVKKVYSSLDAEAVRLIKNMSKKWKPGMRNGIFVRCKYTVPISFRF